MRARVRAAAMVVLALLAAVMVGVPARAAAQADPQPCRSLEGCFGHDEMDGFLHLAADMVDGFLVESYGAHMFDVTVRYVPTGARGKAGCGDGRGGHSIYSDESYEYCPADSTVYIGQEFLWRLYSIGDAAPVIGLAHEFGHMVQDAQGIPSPSSPKESIRHENQADCFAGAWFAYAERQGWVEAPDDLQDLNDVLHFIASKENAPDRDHGTLAERTASVRAGRGALSACNAAYPSTPLHSPKDLALWDGVLADLRRRSPWLGA